MRCVYALELQNEETEDEGWRRDAGGMQEEGAEEHAMHDMGDGDWRRIQYRVQLWTVVSMFFFKISNLLHESCHLAPILWTVVFSE